MDTSLAFLAVLRENKNKSNKVELINELTDFGLQAISPTRRFGVQSTAL